MGLKMEGTVPQELLPDAKSQTPGGELDRDRDLVPPSVEETALDEQSSSRKSSS